MSDSESNSSESFELENHEESNNANSETIASLLEQLSNNLYQYDVHVQYIRSLRQATLYDELKEAREMMHSIFPLSEEMWREWIDDESRIASTKEEKQRVIQLFSKAVQDYLSINLWKEYISYMVQEYKNDLNKMELDVDETECTVTLDQVRKILDEANRETCYYITESHQIWDSYRDFEIEILEASPRDDEQKDRVRRMYENRLKIPHATVDKTFSDYSSFITKYDNSNYESIMIEANKYVSETKNKYYERDRYENALTISGNALNKFMDYIEFEKRPKKPVINAIRTLYERAIAIYYLDHTLWENYILFLIDKHLDKKVPIGILIKTAERSVRNCSWSGDLWSHYIRILEKNFNPPEEIENVYKRALSTGMLNNNVDDLIKVITSKIDYERRKILAYKGKLSEENASGIINLLEKGIKMVKETFETGDLYHRLENYLIEIETSINNITEARKVWDELSKYHRNKSDFWIRYANWEKNIGNFDEARKIYKKASQLNTDWPEYIFDAWEQFEHQYGTVANLEIAIIFIKRQVTIVAQRREKAALKDAQNAQYEGLLQIASNEPLETINYKSSEQYSETKKRKPEEGEYQMTAAKRSKAQQFEKPKRDREFATIVVSNLPLDVKEGELKTLFHECGKIKEVRLLEDTINAQKTAYIEFNERESVPAALTKDKKRIGDQEISVYKIFECTLFVTNFPPSVDIKELFKKYGEIISVRMPNSTKFKKKRVFCYVEFKEKDSAQAALEMNGHELEPGKKISVVISNPSLKKERSPPRQTEVYVKNLPSNVNRSELETLFQAYGPVIDVRIPVTADEKGRGIAFVEFKNEEHAKASLALNSTEFKGCGLNVSLSTIDRNSDLKEDEREKKKKFKHKQEEIKKSEQRSKVVVFTKLPEDITEERIREMLSQIFKDEAINKITMMPHDKCAHVEFEHITDAGRAVLHFNKYKLNDTIISVMARSDLPSELAVLQRGGKPANTTMIPRRLVVPSNKLGIRKRSGPAGSKP